MACYNVCPTGAISIGTNEGLREEAIELMKSSLTFDHTHPLRDYDMTMIELIRHEKKLREYKRVADRQAGLIDKQAHVIEAQAAAIEELKRDVATAQESLDRFERTWGKIQRTLPYKMYKGFRG